MVCAKVHLAWLAHLLVIAFRYLNEWWWRNLHQILSVSTAMSMGTTPCMLYASCSSRSIPLTYSRHIYQALIKFDGATVSPFFVYSQILDWYSSSANRVDSPSNCIRECVSPVSKGATVSEQTSRGTDRKDKMSHETFLTCILDPWLISILASCMCYVPCNLCCL